MMDYIVVHDDVVSRFEVVELEDIAYLEYEEIDGIMDITHIFLPPSMRGKGIAILLVKEAIQYAVEMHLLIKPTCPFAKAFFEKNIEYVNLIV